MKKNYITMLFVFLLCISRAAFAQEYTFIGAGSWSSAANWDENGIPPNPTIAQNIYIDGTGPAILDFDQVVTNSSPFGSLITIQPSNTLIINADNQLTINASSFENKGTLIIHGRIDATGTTINNLNATCTNNGTLNFTLGGGINTYSPLINNGTINIDATSSIYNPSTFTNNGTVNNNSVDPSGSFSNPGTFDNYGTLDNSGPFKNLEPGFFATTAVLNNYSIINNNATGIFSSGGTFNNYATFNNLDGGQILIYDGSPGSIVNNNTGAVLTNDGSWTNFSNTSIINDGTLENNAVFTHGGTLTNNNILNNNAAGTIDNTGTVTNAGTMSNSGTFVNDGTFNQNQNFSQTGTYKGQGIFGGSNFTNNGTVAPGASPGCLSFGAGFTNAGTLDMEVNGTTACTDFDQLNVTGTATAGGTLSVTFGFTPSVGQTFQIINADNFGGSFSIVSSTPAHSVSYSNGVLTVNTVLPIKLIFFNATLQQNDVIINWKTTDAVNFSHFEIERSTDGRSFLLIGQKAAINSNREIRYDHTDANAANAYRTYGNVYYRLKMVDMDGKFSYSNILKVSLGKNNGGFVISTQPNPFTDKINISLNMQENGVVTVRLIDILGRVLSNRLIATGRGFSTIVVDGLERMNSGIYLLQIQSNQGIVTEKLVKE